MLSRVTTLWVPVSPFSASVPFNVPLNLLDKSDLLFEFVNPNPFDVALEGTPVGGTFMQASWPGPSWLIHAREHSQTYISKKPVFLSAVAVSTPGNPLPDEGYDYSTCRIGLIYGTGRIT
jgi:hypothetical protein